MRDALGMTSDRVYRWRVILEEYGSNIVYIKGIHNIRPAFILCISIVTTPQLTTTIDHVLDYMNLLSTLPMYDGGKYYLWATRNHM